MTQRYISNVVTTWTSSGTTYTGIGINVYATAYESNSRPFAVRVNGNTIFSLDALGTLRGNTVNIIFNTANAAYEFANNLAVSTGDPAFSFRHANSSFDKANMSFTTVNSAFGLANTANASSVKLVRSTQTIYGEINVSGNIVTTNSTSSVSSKQIKSNYYTPKDISYVSDAGYNTFFMIVDGKLYSCHGTQASWSAYQAGRAEANGYQADWGFEGLRIVMFPYETTAKVIQADFSGSSQCAYALFDNGNLYTWGSNSYGACGLGHTSTVWTPQLAATSVTAVYGSGYLTAQNGYGAARLFIKKSDGYIYGCGYNGYGQLGFGDTTDRSSFTQITSFGTDVKYVWNLGANYGSTFIVKNDNSIFACGYNGYGTFGNGGTSNYYSPIDITSYYNPSKQEVTKIVGHWSNYNSMGMLLGNGDFYTCGYNGNYEVGNGGSSNVYTPYKVLTGVTGAWAIGVGNGNATFFAAIGSNLYSWGYNGYGQCGNGNTSGLTTPTLVRSGNFSDFMNGNSIDHTYGNYGTAIIKGTDGNLYAAGWGGYGECGNSYTNNTNTGWNRILLPGDFNPVKVGSYGTTGTTREYIAVGADNRLYAWGYNSQYGVHNNNISQHITVPMQIFARLGG